MNLCEPEDLFAPQLCSRPPPFVTMQTDSSSAIASGNKRKFSQIAVDTEDIEEDEFDFQPSQKRQRTSLKHERFDYEAQQEAAAAAAAAQESEMPSLSSDASTQSPADPNSVAETAPTQPPPEPQNKRRREVQPPVRAEYQRDFFVDCTEEHPKHGANYVNGYCRPRGMTKGLWLVSHPILHLEISASEMYDAVRNLAWLKDSLLYKSEVKERLAQGEDEDSFMCLSARQVHLLFGRGRLSAPDTTMDSGAYVAAHRLAEWITRVNATMAASYSNWMALNIAVPDEDSEVDLRVEVTAMKDLHLLISQTKNIAEDLALVTHSLDFAEASQDMYLYVGDESDEGANQVLATIESVKRSLLSAANHLAQLEYHAQTNMSGIFDAALRNHCLVSVNPLANAIRGVMFTIRHAGLMHYRS